MTFVCVRRAAWEWLWSWLSQSMEQSLEEASNEATILTQSWDMAMDNCPGTEFGELLFDVLFEIAPNMKAIFNKPKQILSVSPSLFLARARAHTHIHKTQKYYFVMISSALRSARGQFFKRPLEGPTRADEGLPPLSVCA